MFLFKLHAPDNFIVGGGVFAHANALPCSLAWEAFGEANGAATLAEMRARIARYKRLPTADWSDFQVGCRLLTQPLFLPESEWIPVPASFAKNIVSFKTYSTADQEGLALWETIERHIGVGPRGNSSGAGMTEGAARYGPPTLVLPRLGRGTFRVIVRDNYDRRCAVTGERTLPALDAAHIRPYAEGGLHAASNGILFRRDIHSLFDAGYVTVTKGHMFEVSRRIREEFENGRHYYAMHGTPLSVPDRADRRPDPRMLEWHNTARFRG